MTRPYAEVIGDPIAQSKSPLIHNFWLAKLGIDAEYRACHVRPEELADYFARRRGDAQWRGCNVTIPHKIRAFACADVVEAAVREIGATNCLVPAAGGLVAANTDIEGVAGPINLFHDHAFNFGPVKPRKVGIIGAGGAARAAIFALKTLGWVSEWRLAVRRPEAGQALLSAFKLADCGFVTGIEDAAFEGLDILINASSLGMGDSGESGLTLSRLGDGNGQALVFDMVYFPMETGLIRAAKRQGHAVIGGLDMLIAQAGGAFQRFFGESPPRESYPDLRELLTK